MTKSPSIAVIGLGYVGLPLAVALSRHFSVIGYDIDLKRITDLSRGEDRTREVSAETLRTTTMKLTNAAGDIAGADILIVAVPTPVDRDNRPDLTLLLAACRTAGQAIRSGAIVVFESTVYPGCTEQVCAPVLEAESGLAAGRDFWLGYSPERINPGDSEHGLDHIVKVVAGQTPDVVETLVGMYGALNGGAIHRAADIRTAEASKVIENAQRDINIAFVNEVARICQAMDLSTYQVLEAAGTKWNFLPFTPGLVGGHCIGVDPYYLAFAARQVGIQPEVILAGRRMNDTMADFLADAISRRLKTRLPDRQGHGPRRILVLGATFKENVPDLRNSRAVDLAMHLAATGDTVDVHDPVADPGEAKALLGMDLLPTLTGAQDYDCVVGAVAHRDYRAFTADMLARLLGPRALVADIKGMWTHLTLAPEHEVWVL
ncbi:MAG: nucleotide sugar dehydrogenase [Inquilinaceae bacterium]